MEKKFFDYIASMKNAAIIALASSSVLLGSSAIAHANEYEINNGLLEWNNGFSASFVINNKSYVPNDDTTMNLKMFTPGNQFMPGFGGGVSYKFSYDNDLTVRVGAYLLYNSEKLLVDSEATAKNTESSTTTGDAKTSEVQQYNTTTLTKGTTDTSDFLETTKSTVPFFNNGVQSLHNQMENLAAFTAGAGDLYTLSEIGNIAGGPLDGDNIRATQVPASAFFNPISTRLSKDIAFTGVANTMFNDVEENNSIAKKLVTNFFSRTTVPELRNQYAKYSFSFELARQLFIEANRNKRMQSFFAPIDDISAFRMRLGGGDNTVIGHALNSIWKNDANRPTIANIGYGANADDVLAERRTVFGGPDHDPNQDLFKKETSYGIVKFTDNGDFSETKEIFKLQLVRRILENGEYSAQNAISVTDIQLVNSTPFIEHTVKTLKVDPAQIGKKYATLEQVFQYNFPKIRDVFLHLAGANVDRANLVNEEIQNLYARGTHAPENTLLLVPVGIIYEGFMNGFANKLEHLLSVYHKYATSPNLIHVIWSQMTFAGKTLSEAIDLVKAEFSNLLDYQTTTTKNGTIVSSGDDKTLTPVTKETVSANKIVSNSNFTPVNRIKYSSFQFGLDTSISKKIADDVEAGLMLGLNFERITYSDSKQTTHDSKNSLNWNSKHDEEWGVDLSLGPCFYYQIDSGISISFAPAVFHFNLYGDKIHTIRGGKILDSGTVTASTTGNTTRNSNTSGGWANNDIFALTHVSTELKIHWTL